MRFLIMVYRIFPLKFVKRMLIKKHLERIDAIYDMFKPSNMIPIEESLLELSKLMEVFYFDIIEDYDLFRNINVKLKGDNSEDYLSRLVTALEGLPLTTMTEQMYGELVDSEGKSFNSWFSNYSSIKEIDVVVGELINLYIIYKSTQVNDINVDKYLEARNIIDGVSDNTLKFINSKSFILYIYTYLELLKVKLLTNSN